MEWSLKGDDEEDEKGAGNSNHDDEEMAGISNDGKEEIKEEGNLMQVDGGQDSEEDDSGDEDYVPDGGAAKARPPSGSKV